MTNQILSRSALHKTLGSLASYRKSIRNYFIVLGVLSVAVFFCSPQLLQGLQRHLGGTLYFFSVAGPFLAHVKLAVFAAFFLLVPWSVVLFWQVLGKIFGLERHQLLLIILFSCLLFYVGTVFCYFVTLPFGIKFLLGFGSEELRPVISVGQCVNFVTIFMLAFGLVFELPVLMVFFSRVRLFSLHGYRRNRRYAILMIAILSAVLTPTPDVVNMALMGIPLYLLYEVGICIVQMLETKGVDS